MIRLSVIPEEGTTDLIEVLVPYRVCHPAATIFIIAWLFWI